jgi:hypothetical protein
MNYHRKWSLYKIMGLWHVRDRGEPDERDVEVVELLTYEKEIKSYKKVARLFMEFGRVRGYPTGPEWLELMTEATELLK